MKAAVTEKLLDRSRLRFNRITAMASRKLSAHVAMSRGVLKLNIFLSRSLCLPIVAPSSISSPIPLAYTDFCRFPSAVRISILSFCTLHSLCYQLRSILEWEKNIETFYPFCYFFLRALLFFTNNTFYVLRALLHNFRQVYFMAETLVYKRIMIN